MLYKKRNLFIFFSYILCLLLLGITLIIGLKLDIPFKKLTGDPFLTFNAHPFTGVISNIGVLIWSTTFSICIFSGIILRKLGKKNESLFLMASGIFSFLLLIDDLFMFHDYIFYSFEKFQISQKIVYSLYAILMLSIGLKFFKMITHSNYSLLLVALFFLGSSVLTDLIFPSEGFEYFIEDALKFIGIVSWMLYFTTTSYGLIMSKNKKDQNKI